MTLKELNKNYGFKKKLVISGSKELYKRECEASARAGIASVNCESMSLTLLAKDLFKDYKIGLGEKFEEIDKPTQMGLMLASALDLARNKKLVYFRESMLDGGTVKQLLNDIGILRLEAALEAVKDSADPKLRDVYTLANAYIERIDKLNLYDNVKILNEAIRLISEKKIDTYAKVIAIYKDDLDELSFIEHNFFDAITSAKEVIILETEETNVELSSEKQFFRVFGLHNEIHAIVKDIINRKLPLEQVQIVASTSSGFYPLITYLQKLNILYCLPEGISEQYSYVATQIQIYIKNPANFEIDSEGNVDIKAVFEGLADRLEVVSSRNNLPQPIVVSLLGKASICRKNMESYAFEANYNVVVKLIESMLIGGNCTEENSEEGALFISSLNYAEVGFRPYIYMMGFESRNYPGGINQSPILLDIEMDVLGLPKHYKSDYRREKQEAKLNRIISSNAKVITMSYVSYDTVNMREQNPSAFLQRILKNSGCKERLYGFSEVDKEMILEVREWILQKEKV